MLKKLLVSAVLTMPLSSAMAGQGEIQNIDQLRDLCRNLEANDQVKFFDKGLICKGSHTLWKKREGRSDLPNQGTICAKTSYDKCDTPLSTPGDQVTFESRYNTAACHIYDKYRVLAPQVPIFVNSCEELTVENVELLCSEAIADSCFDPIDSSTDQGGIGKGGIEQGPGEIDQGDQAQQQGPIGQGPIGQGPVQQQEPMGGACVMERVGTFNTCDLYGSSCPSQVPVPMPSSSYSSSSSSSSSSCSSSSSACCH
ncbi:MAG: hypothetical protein AB8G05_19365 [Oligoflexales bacterium]